MTTHSRRNRLLPICAFPAIIGLTLLACGGGTSEKSSREPGENHGNGGNSNSDQSGGAASSDGGSTFGGDQATDGNATSGGNSASGGAKPSGDDSFSGGSTASGGAPSDTPTPRPREGLYDTGMFTHPGIYSSIGQLEFVKAKVLANEQPWKKAFEELLATEPTTRKLTAQAVVPGSADPQERKEMDEMTKDGEYANAAALLWYLTGEKKYAEFAIKTLNAWSVFKRTGMPLYLTWAVPHFLNAAELMKNLPGSEWQESEIEKFSAMVETQMWPKVQMPSVNYGSNHGATAAESMFAIAVFLEDKEKFDDAVVAYEWLMPRYLYLNQAPHLNGETNETCRDLNHTKLGVIGILNSAEIAWNQGVDLWEKHELRIATMAEFHAGIMMGKTTVPSNLCAFKAGQAGKVYCQGNVPWADPKGAPPCNEASWETIVNHVGDRLGSNIPWTREMAERNRPLGSINRRAQKWTTLLKAEVSTEL